MFQVIEVFLSDILVLDRSVAKPVRKVRLGGTRVPMSQSLRDRGGVETRVLYSDPLIRVKVLFLQL